MRPSTHRFVVLFLIGICLSRLLTQCNSGSNKKEENYFLNLNDSVHYVGIQECRKCHEDHYRTFIQTGMGQSFGTADPAHSKAIFLNAKPVYDSKKDMWYFPSIRWDGFYITEFRLKNRDTIFKRSEKLTHIIGSGHHTNSHMWMDNGYLYQAPLTWYSQEQKWDLPPGYETTNTRFGRAIDIECMSCHNAMPAVAAGSINKFTRLPSGIDCERCHGPGELHVKEKQSGHIVDIKKEADRSIVNPSRLPWKLQVDVCQRCHLQGNNVLKPGKAFTDFKPGMHLDSVFTVYMPTKGGEKTFFMAGHAERLQMSACFKGSNKKEISTFNPQMNFTCITCHNPHVSVRKTNVIKFNAACENCHNPKGNSALIKCSDLPQNILHKNNNCVGCHMPSSGAADIPHVTVHDHYIRKQKKNQKKEIEKTIDGIYAVNGNADDKRSRILGLITWFEKFDAAPALMEQARKNIQESDIFIQIHFYYANQEFMEITRLSLPEKNTCDAWSCYRIAKAFDQTGDAETALDWYRTALEKQALNPGFAAEYGNCLIRQKRLTEARKVLEKSLQMQAKYELTLLNLGTLEWLENKIAPARNYWLRCLELNPDQLLAHEYLAALYNRTGEKDKEQNQQEWLRANRKKD